MKDGILSRAHRIDDARVAAAFSDPLRRRLVLLLADQERSVAELSRLSGLELKRLHYHVTALRKLGLLVVTNERPRAGRAVKIYRAAAGAFFVPERLAPSGSTAALALELRNSLDTLRDRSRDGVLFFLGEDGEPRMRPVKNPTPTAVDSVEYWNVLHLTRSDARRLAEDVRDCLQRYTSRSGGTRGRYLVHFAFAPSKSPKSRRPRLR